MSTKPSQTEAVVSNHLQAFFNKSIEGVLADYAEDSVFIVPGGPLVGVGEIRKFFTAFIEGMPEGFLEAFKMHRQEFVGEMAYIVWEAAPWVHLGTDTFIVRNRKIGMQTFTSYPALS